MTYVSVLFTKLRLGTHYNVVMLGTPGWVQRFIIVPSQLNCIVASGHLVDDQLLEVVELVVPLVQGLVPGAALASPLQLQHARHLQQHIALLH